MIEALGTNQSALCLGAAVADLVVLLVAVDDGVCSQTEESIGVAEELGRSLAAPQMHLSLCDI